MGGKLFKKVAAAARLKKLDFKKPDCVPRTYDRKEFQLHGRMDNLQWQGATHSHLYQDVCP